MSNSPMLSSDRMESTAKVPRYLTSAEGSSEWVSILSRIVIVQSYHMTPSSLILEKIVFSSNGGAIEAIRTPDSQKSFVRFE